MTKNLMSNVHFQVRLVKELRGSPGRLQIITHPVLAKPKEGANDDHTLDLHATERSALQAARNYCSRGDRRKGLLPGQFLGVVVVRFESDPSGSKRVPTTIPKRLMKGSDWGRKRREPDTTTWLYYIEPQSCKAFHVDTGPSGEHHVGREVEVRNSSSGHA
jgi:hypothetical protein